MLDRGLVSVFKNIFKRIAYYYPLTWLGSILWCLSLFLLAKAYIDLSPFSLLLALTALMLIFLLALLSRIQALHFAKQPPEWDTSMPLYAQQPDLRHYVYTDRIRVWLFFRLHFRLKGKFAVEKNTCYFFSQENSSAFQNDQERITIPLCFPVCGILPVRGQLFIKDILGLTRARMGEEQARTLFIRPANGLYRQTLPLLAMDGFENTSRKKDANEEKYYQREYMPGDRFRDINWKVYGRINQLVTKVSHITQEKTRLVTIYFRHYKPPGRMTADALAHLNYLKSWLLTFLKTVKNENPDYTFRIFTGTGVFNLETVEDLERFGLEIIPLYYQSAPLTPDQPAPSGEVFIFSSPYDIQLPQALAALASARVNLFRTIFLPPASENQTAVSQEPGTHTSVGKKSGKPKEALKSPTNRSATMTIALLRPLLATPLPGFWLLARDRYIKNPGLTRYNQGMLEEVALQVKLF
jgi:hypothetical protein